MYKKTIRLERKNCPICRNRNKINYIPSVKHWYCLNCDTEFDRHNTIYVYNELGDLVEIISDPVEG